MSKFSTEMAEMTMFYKDRLPFQCTNRYYSGQILMISKKLLVFFQTYLKFLKICVVHILELLDVCNVIIFYCSISNLKPFVEIV